MLKLTEFSKGKCIFCIIWSLAQQGESGYLTDEHTEVQGGKLIKAEPHSGLLARQEAQDLRLMPRRPQADILNGNDRGGGGVEGCWEPWQELTSLAPCGA